MVFITCNLHWRCFFYANWPIYSLMCTNTLVFFPTCTVWWWWYVYMCVCICVFVCVCTLTTLYGSDVHVMEVSAVCKRCCIGLGFCGVTWKADQLGSNSVVVWSVMLHIAAHTP